MTTPMLPIPMSPSPIAPPHMSPSPVSPFRAWPRRWFPASLAALTLSAAACRQPDFTEAATPVVATSLALVSQVRVDTGVVDVTLGGGAPTSLGSFTGEVVHDGAWRFVGCEAQQAQALLACKEYGSTVRVAAAWPGGTHAGALVRLTYVKAAPSVLSQWTFAVSEATGVRGSSMLDSLDVKRLSTEGAR